MLNNGKSNGDIAVALNITLESARHVCNYEINVNKKIRGSKQKICVFNVYRLHAEIGIIKISRKKVATTILIINCNLNIWQTTCWRTLKRLGYNCRKESKHIVLTKNLKEGRLQCVTQWLNEGHD